MTNFIKGTLGDLAYVFQLNRGKNVYFFFTYLITLSKDVTFPLI